ncbi:MAG: hypothetical protein GPJ15_13040 [Microcystis aeruginosa G11-06]|nr:hypothetical protein [Microcystis aeruginosa G11-06]NCS49301.1 hypothetical protein [Microcystis aeruginosa BK11-02]
MARDKLITVRIEGEKREAFNQLAKSQNTDTASLLYDFISGCLDGTIDIKLVTGKKQWIDKIDNQLDTNRLDKLEATTQEIDNQLDTIAKKLADYVEAFDDRLNDCDQGLSNKITSLEHRLNALSIQLDSQQDSQQLDRIDTDSQGDSQGEPLIKEALKLDYLNDQSLVDAIETQIEDTEIDESDYEDEPDTSPLPPSPPAIETAIEDTLGTGSETEIVSLSPSAKRKGLTDSELARHLRIDKSNITRWKQKGHPTPKYQNQWELRGRFWHEKD